MSLAVERSYQAEVNKYIRVQKRKDLHLNGFILDDTVALKYAHKDLWDCLGTSLVKGLNYA